VIPLSLLSCIEHAQHISFDLHNIHLLIVAYNDERVSSKMKGLSRNENLNLSSGSRGHFALINAIKRQV